MSSLVVFVPAIHTGYINFFKKYEGVLYLLGPDILCTTTRAAYLDRDLRATNPEDMKKMIESLNIFRAVYIATPENLSRISGPTILPQDEVSTEIAEKYLSGKEVQFENIYLRRTKIAALKEDVVTAGKTIAEGEFHTQMMGVAEAHARKSSDWWRQIGALILKEGRVVLTAYNKRFPSDYSQDMYGDPRSNFDAGERIDLAATIHSEAWLVAQAARKGISLEGTTMYVTTFPCPTCAKSVAESGVKQLYYKSGYSLLDAEKILGDAGVEIVLVRS